MYTHTHTEYVLTIYVMGKTFTRLLAVKALRSQKLYTDFVYNRYWHLKPPPCSRFNYIFM